MGALAGAQGSPQTDAELASMPPPWGPTRAERWGIPSCFSSSFKPSNDSNRPKNYARMSRRCTQSLTKVCLQLVTLLEQHLQTRRELQTLPVHHQTLETPARAFCFPLPHPQNSELFLPSNNQHLRLTELSLGLQSVIIHDKGHRDSCLTPLILHCRANSQR